jgi:hypothetical protein
MEDDEITLCNTCTDLVGLKKMEAFPLRLLESKPPGEWICVREFSLQIGVVADNLKPELFATWLPDPLANGAYAVIMFYDDESKWSMAAHYNRARLLGTGAANPENQPTGAAVSASSDSTSQQAAPTAQL